jgi:hypothetical protein
MGSKRAGDGSTEHRTPDILCRGFLTVMIGL